MPVLTRLLKTSTGALLTSSFSHAAGHGTGIPERPGENTENWGLQIANPLENNVLPIFHECGFFRYSPCPSEAKEGPRSAGAVSLED